MEIITESAFAKINLTLDVLGRREDGYHDIRSIMQTISLRDDVVINADAGEADQASAQKQLKASYLGRIMIMAFAIVVGVIVPWFHYIAVLVPFLVPQPVMLLRRAMLSARARRDDTDKKGES